MDSANDNSSRHIRDGFRKKWGAADFTTISTDEALIRLAEARNATSKNANRYMLFATLISIIYFLRLRGLASNIKFGEYNLADLPFGLFVFSFTALMISTLSLIKIGDSRSYDRQLLFACEQRYKNDSQLTYLTFPNAYAWGEPFTQMVNIIKNGWKIALLKELPLFLINIFLLTLAISPIITGIDFIINFRYNIELNYQNIQIALISFLLLTNIATYILMFWVRLIDHD